MTDRPVELDACRTRSDQIAVAFRRQGAECGFGASMIVTLARNPALHAQLLARPADTWVDVCRKLAFLVEAYARTPQAQDPQIHTLVRRALGDVARLTRLEDRKP